MSVTHETKTGPRRTGTLIALVVVLLAAGGAAYRGIATRAQAMAVLTRETQEMAVTTVAVVRPQRGAPQQELVLPGTTRAFVDAP
ncbi:MAG TPA: hypothetical protein VND92_01980, partial [Vicinamibacterales bacterium]|nr:hypothetical protein [Vicinamibacterales bacterium]